MSARPCGGTARRIDRRAGKHYVVTIEAQRCEEGESIAREQELARGKEQVLEALGEAAERLRRRPGESRDWLRTHTTPVAKATTTSLEALKADSLALRARRHEGNEAAIPLLKQSVEIDPESALAHAWLSGLLGNQGLTAESARHAQRAYDLRGKVSEYERLYIESIYYAQVVGDFARRIGSLELIHSERDLDSRIYLFLALARNDRAASIARLPRLLPACSASSPRAPPCTTGASPTPAASCTPSPTNMSKEDGTGRGGTAPRPGSHCERRRSRGCGRARARARRIARPAAREHRDEGGDCRRGGPARAEMWLQRAVATLEPQGQLKATFVAPARASIAVGRRQNADAIKLLAPPARFERRYGMIALVRGLAYKPRATGRRRRGNSRWSRPPRGARSAGRSPACSCC